jgi:hypothetical protein
MVRNPYHRRKIRGTIVTTISNNPAAICIRDMAAQCGLSRQRFMQLVKAGVFPAPLYDEESKRPYFSEELQAQCLDVRKKNIGINGKVVMFYSRRPNNTPTTPKAKKPQTNPAGSDRHADVVDGLKALGLVTVTTTQVAEAVGQLFPKGTEKVEPGEVIRAVFVHLHSKNSRGNVGRK